MNKMQKLKIIGVVCVVLLVLSGIAYFTLPTETFVRQHIKQEVYKAAGIDTLQQATQTQKEGDLLNTLQQLGSMFQQELMKPMIDKAVDNALQVESYHIFLLLKVTFKDEEKIIGVAAFRQVFLFVNLKTLVAEQMKAGFLQGF